MDLVAEQEKVWPLNCKLLGWALEADPAAPRIIAEEELRRLEAQKAGCGASGHLNLTCRPGLDF